MLNLQKLLEALVYAAIRVEARPHHRDAEAGERVREITSLIRDLPARTIPPALRRVIEGARGGMQRP
jgi:hypothetical protein